MKSISRSTKSVRLVILSSFLLLAACFGQTIKLSANSGPPTTHITVSGSNFPANTAVDIYFDTSDLALASTDGTGAFSKISIQVASTALPGTHAVTGVSRSNQASGQAPFTVATNWAQFGFTPNNQRSNPYENVLTPANVGGLDLNWVFSNGSILSSPTAAQGNVYVGSFDGNLYAVNATTGAKVWSFATGGNIYCTPAFAQGNVYFGSYDGNVYAVNAKTGALVWSYPTGIAVQNSPTVANGVVYIAANFSNLLALNATTGALLWSFGASGSIAGQVALADGLVYLNSGTNLYAINPSNGSTVWTGGISGGLLGTPVVSQGIVFFDWQTDFAFAALNAFNGNNIWLGNFTANSFSASNGVLYTVSENIVAANNARSGGTNIWAFMAGATVNSTPAIANGVVYVGSDDANLYALDAATGNFLWSFNTGGAIDTSPVVANGVVFAVPGDGNLYAFGLPNGPRWKGTAPSPSTLHPDLSLKVTQTSEPEPQSSQRDQAQPTQILD